MTGDLLTPALLFVFGLMVGSFLNVVIHRWPRGESVVSPGSRCGACGTPIRWYDNVPVVSYLALGARCRACAAPIGVRYVVVELVTGALFALAAIELTPGPLLAVRVLFTAALVALFAIDLEHQLLPDVITLPGIALGLVAAWWLPPGPLSSAAGAALGAGVLWGIRWFWLRLRGEEGMGLGDVKMLAMVGAVLGWPHVWLTLLLASVVGAVVGIALSVSGGSWKTRLPFGTFLAAAALASSYWGEPLIDWYVSLLTVR